MGGSTRQSSSSTQTTTLPQNQQANVDLLMQGARDLFASGGPQYFPGQNYTQPTPDELRSREMARGYATGAGQEYAQSAVAGNQFWMDPRRVFDVQSVPGYGAVRQGIQDTVTRNLTENILPQSALGGVATGDLGGSRQGLMDALAMGRTSEALASSLGALDLGVSNANRASQGAALDRAGSIYQTGVAPANTLANVGAAGRADEAERIAAEMDRWNFDQNKPFNLLAMLQALTGTAGQYGGTVSQEGTTTQSGGGGIGQILGPLLMATGLLTGQPWLTAGGAATAGAGAGTGVRTPVY